MLQTFERTDTLAGFGQCETDDGFVSVHASHDNPGEAYVAVRTHVDGRFDPDDSSLMFYVTRNEAAELAQLFARVAAAL
jgi:hypothetical protein